LATAMHCNLTPPDLWPVVLGRLITRPIMRQSIKF